MFYTLYNIIYNRFFLKKNEVKFVDDFNVKIDLNYVSDLNKCNV